MQVNKQCSNVGCRNELARIPLQHIINTAIVRYLYYLKELPDNYIAKMGLQMCTDMSAKQLTDHYKLVDISSVKSENQWSNFISSFNLNMRNDLIAHNLDLLESNRKLSFYTKFRFDCKEIEFLDAIKNPKHRKNINKNRLGNHQFRIESGRHTIPKTSEHLRFCLFCNSTDIENESHFLFSCNLYNDIHIKYFSKINNRYHNFNELGNKSNLR